MLWLALIMKCIYLSLTRESIQQSNENDSERGKRIEMNGVECEKDINYSFIFYITFDRQYKVNLYCFEYGFTLDYYFFWVWSEIASSSFQPPVIPDILFLLHTMPLTSIPFLLQWSMLSIIYFNSILLLIWSERDELDLLELSTPTMDFQFKRLVLEHFGEIIMTWLKFHRFQSAVS